MALVMIINSKSLSIQFSRQRRETWAELSGCVGKNHAQAITGCKFYAELGATSTAPSAQNPQHSSPRLQPAWLSLLHWLP